MSKRALWALLLTVGLMGTSVGFKPMDDAAPTRAGEPVKTDETTPPAGEKPTIPTPAELIRQMKERAAAKDAKSLVAQIDFSSPVSEQPAGASLFGQGGTDLRTILARLRKAEADVECKAVLLTFYNGGMLNFAQAQEVREVLASLKKSGKRTFVYADSFDTISYTVATAATDVV